MKSTYKNSRFVPIPILNSNADNNDRGRVIYRGFNPKSSDFYFRILKDVSEI